MTLTPKEARDALAEIDLTAKRMRNTLAASELGPNLMIWGVVWAVGFLLSHLLPGREMAVWTVLLAAGGAATAFTVIRLARKRLVQSAAESRLGRQLLLFWITIFAYAILMIAIIKPTDGRLFCLVFIIFSMMAYIVMGIWVRSSVLAVTGVLVTVASVIGYWYEPLPFLIWMAIFGGGGLFLPGLYVHWRWR